MLVVSQLSKRFPGAEDAILHEVSFTLNAGERVGLIGPNGAGKSTLLQLIAGDLAPDTGSVTWTRPDIRVGYLRQGLTLPPETAIYDALFPEAEALQQAEEAVADLGVRLSQTPDDAELGDAYQRALDQLTALGQVVDVAAAERTLAHVGLNVALDDPVGALSGGEQTRLMLARVLLGRPNLLLLDEPTNHLDVDALNWLENWLRSYQGGVLLVSHDRAFLDRIVNRVVLLNAQTHTARVFPGNYSDVLATLEHERAQQWAAWRDQQVEIERMRQDVQQMKDRASKRENATVNDFQRGRAKVVARKAKAREARLQRYLEADERVTKPGQTWQVKLDFDHLPAAHGDVLRLENAAIGYDPAAPLLRELTLTVQGGERIAIMGPNGQGKTTLLKSVLGELPLLAGSVKLGRSVQVGYLAQQQDILDPASTPLDTLLNEVHMGHTAARSFLHHFLFAGEEVFRPVAALSYGERARLMLAVLVARGANLLVMDEPLNHLDLPSREQFETALEAYPGSVLAVVHDRAFVERFATHVWTLANGALQVDHLAV